MLCKRYLLKAMFNQKYYSWVCDGFAVWPPLNSPTTKLITKPASMLSFNLLVNIPLNYIFSSPFLENGHSFNIYAAITKGRCTNFNLTLESCWLIARCSIHKLLLSLSNFSNNWQRVTNMTNEFACRFYRGSTVRIDTFYDRSYESHDAW